MSWESVASFLRDAGTGYVLGFLTAAWLHAVWRRCHPHTIRFWGTWYTEPRFLVGSGLLLITAWLGFFIVA